MVDTTPEGPKITRGPNFDPDKIDPEMTLEEVLIEFGVVDQQTSELDKNKWKDLVRASKAQVFKIIPNLDRALESFLASIDLMYTFKMKIIEGITRSRVNEILIRLNAEGIEAILSQPVKAPNPMDNPSVSGQMKFSLEMLNKSNLGGDKGPSGKLVGKPTKTTKKSEDDFK